MMNILTIEKIGRRNRFLIPLNGGEIYPNLLRMSFDLFAILAMLSECECIFSKATYTIAARKSNLSLNIVNGGEFLSS